MPIDTTVEEDIPEVIPEFPILTPIAYLLIEQIVPIDYVQIKGEYFPVDYDLSFLYIATDFEEVENFMPEDDC